jgi:hypothetical protein
MSASIRKKIVYVFAVAALIWCAFNYEWNSKPTRPVPAASAPAIASIVPPTTAHTSLKINVDSLASLGWGDDPFRVESSGGMSTGADHDAAWTVSGIIYSDTKPMAVVNGHSVQVGDSVGGAMVVAIKRHQVKLRLHDSEFSIAVTKG